jgi:WD40 repeat protein
MLKLFNAAASDWQERETLAVGTSWTGRSRIMNSTTRLVRLILAVASTASGVLAQSPRIVWSQQAHAGAVNAVDFSPDGKIIATAGADHVVKLWRTRNGAPLSTVAQYYDEASSVDFSSDGTWLASGSSDTTFQVTSLLDGHGICESGTTGFVRDVAFAPDKSRLAVALGYFSNDLDIYDITQCQLASILTPHWGTVWSVSYSPEGSWFASTGADGLTAVFRASDNQQILSLTGHDNDVSDVAFTPDGAKVASCGFGDYKVLVWNVPSGALALNLHASGNFLHGIDVSPDGQLVAACGEHYPVHGSIIMWRVADGSLVASFDSSLATNVLSIAFAPNGRGFAAGLDDGRLVLALTPPH